MNESEYGHGLGAPTVILSVLPEARPFCVIPVTQRFVSERTCSGHGSLAFQHAAGIKGSREKV